MHLYGHLIQTLISSVFFKTVVFKENKKKKNRPIVDMTTESQQQTEDQAKNLEWKKKKHGNGKIVFW